MPRPVTVPTMLARIPDELVRLVRERRVIPFVGAGFSAGLGLPGWGDLLADVASDLRIGESDPELTYEQLRELADDDSLRVAEYLYIRAGGSIGPLRHSVTNALRTDRSPADYLSHVELLNLGAPQVYTTNFDDLIERTYRELGQPVEVVALPRDVAAADSTMTQVVKYHGDLRFDETLVFTESQYWKRLDFESPMDLKFRSDLLGRSVLFMGYSFSDINIRVIWFKLMQMMRDVPRKDRLRSYIVRLESNPVLEALFEDVGLKTIVLDPNGDAAKAGRKDKLIGEFLAGLASLAAPDMRIPGSRGVKMFASRELLRDVAKELAGLPEAGKPVPAGPGRLARLLGRQVPGPLRGEAQQVLKRLSEVESLEVVQLASAAVAWDQEMTGASAEATRIAIGALLQTFHRDQLLRASGVNWSMVWDAPLDPETAMRILRQASLEMLAHERRDRADDDLAYALDLTVRLAVGLAPSEELKAEAIEIVRRASRMYPSVGRYRPTTSGPPDPVEIVAEIAARAKAA